MPGTAGSGLRQAEIRRVAPHSAPLAILAVLIGRKEPASIEQIHAELGAGRCDLVTVYRCLAAFEEIGLVRRAYFLNGTCLYEINLGKPARYHVVCKQTRRVDDLDPESAAELTRAVQNVEDLLRARGYGDVGHLVEFFGSVSAEARARETKAGAQPATAAS